MRRTVGLLVVGALALGLPACGSAVPKEQLLADARGGDLVAPAGQVAGAAPAVAPQSAAAPGTGANPVVAPAPGDVGVDPVAQTGSGPARASATDRADSRTGADSRRSAPAAAAGCTAPLSEIAIGTVGGMSGFIGSVLRPGVDAIKAWVADTNAKGGLACHPIKYYVADDGGDPAKNAALTQQMVEERKVIAMLYSSNPLSAQGGKPILEKAHVPTIGNEGAAEWFNTSPDFFPVSPSGVKMIVASYAFAASQLTPEQRAHFGALACIEVSLCSQYAGESGAKIAADNGMTMVYNGQATMVAPDYTSNCQSAKNAGVQALMLAGDNGLISRAIRSCLKINFKPVFTTSPIAVTASAVELPELDGLIVNSVVKPWTLDDPQSKRYLAALAKYVPGAVPVGAGAVGWASALVLEHAARNLPANPTAQDVYAGLWTIRNNDFGGFTAPLTFAKDKPAVYPVCWWGMAIRNKAWTTLDNGVRACRK